MNTQNACRIPVQYIQEDKYVVAICPILDVSSYGKNFQEAKANFESALNAFFKETSEHRTLDEVLKEHGWQKVDIKKRPHWNPPVIIRNEYEQVQIPV